MRILIILLFFTFNLGAQQISFVGSADQQSVPQNATIRISYDLNAIGSNFKFPKSDDYKVISGPSTSTNVQIINGSRSQSSSYVLILMPLKEGMLDIAPATIMHRGKQYASNPIKINVVEGEKIEDAIAEGNMFARMELSDSIAYIGQKVQLKYSVFTQEDIAGIDIISQDDMQGFHAVMVESPRGYAKVEMNGKTFYKRTFITYAIFPQKTGVFEIDPVTVNVSKPLKSLRRSFFQRTTSEIYTSNALTLEVKNLPSGAPKSFSGAVGKFVMKSTIKPQKYTTSDPILMEMEIQGTGDPKFWDAPDQNRMGNIEYYDPKLVDERNVKSQWGDASYKKYEYLLLPEEKGTYDIQPEFSYFDTDSLKYITLRSPVKQITVRQGSTAKIDSDVDKEFDQGVESEENQGFKLYWLIPILLLIGAIGYYLLRNKKDETNQRTPEEIEADRKAKAKQVALDTLKVAKGHIDESDEKAFYVEVSNALNQFLGNKFNISIKDRKPDMISKVLQQNDVGAGKIEEYLEIMKKCELSLYALQSQSDMKATYEKAMNLIQSMV